MSDLSLYQSLIGMPMMAVSATGDIYATGIVESVHVKPCGEPRFWAKLSETKAAPIGDLVHFPSMAPTKAEPTSEPELLLKLKAWFAAEIQKSAPVDCYEYKLATVAEELGVGESKSARSIFGKTVKEFCGQEFRVMQVFGRKWQKYEIGFHRDSQASYITFTLVDSKA